MAILTNELLSCASYCEMYWKFIILFILHHYIITIINIITPSLLSFSFFIVIFKSNQAEFEAYSWFWAVLGRKLRLVMCKANTLPAELSGSFSSFCR